VVSYQIWGPTTVFPKEPSFVSGIQKNGGKIGVRGVRTHSTHTYFATTLSHRLSNYDSPYFCKVKTSRALIFRFFKLTVK
jgi:hypothetical protein